MSSIHAAASAGNIQEVEAILARDPEAVYLATVDGDTALHLAAAGGHVAVVELLLATDAEGERMNKHGNTPLVNAVIGSAFTRSHRDVAELLLKRGADVDAAPTSGNWAGQTALLACSAVPWADQLARIRFLLENGASPAATQAGGWTPVHIAVMHNADPKVLKLLLRTGADPRARSQSGKTAIQIAEEQSNWKAAAILRRQAGCLPIVTMAAALSELLWLIFAGGSSGS